MPRKRPKSLDSQIVMKARELEKWVYIRGSEWKKKFRYSLVEEYRQSTSRCKDEIITGFELPKRYSEQKKIHYISAQIELVKAESRMDLMIAPEICIMSDKEWAQAAILIDDIRIGLSRLVNSLMQGVGVSEPRDFGNEGENANHKDT